MVGTVDRELRELGIGSRVVRWNGAGGEAVVFPFDVLSGRFRGTVLDIGLSFQEAAYPEYPPHFIHVRSLDATNKTRHSEHEFEGALWWTFSAPPSNFWDALEPSQKNMRTYVRRHLLRFLDEL
ncbi:hypothetical protein [Candidatus Palauibacter sp.]|uniref:hypothetical protein n=1 Tax=Candidatus Palauibacter sp. TaxID=3101350 RepID=UPI003AF24480